MKGDGEELAAASAGRGVKDQGEGQTIEGGQQFSAAGSWALWPADQDHDDHEVAAIHLAVALAIREEEGVTRNTDNEEPGEHGRDICEVEGPTVADDEPGTTSCHCQTVMFGAGSPVHGMALAATAAANSSATASMADGTRAGDLEGSRKTKTLPLEGLREKSSGGNDCTNSSDSDSEGEDTPGVSRGEEHVEDEEEVEEEQESARPPRGTRRARS